MNLSEEEKIMYEVMESIYDSGIPICFKGSMVLRAYLIEAGYTKDTRHTVDIDASFYANPAPSTEQIAESFQKALDMKGLNI